MGREQLLVVNDDVGLCRVLSRLLGRTGCDITTVHTGMDARAALEEQAWSLVILDVALPDMNGIELLRWFKGREPGIPVIVLTGHQSVHDAVAAMKLGAYDYVTKPVDDDALTSLVDMALVQHRVCGTREPTTGSANWKDLSGKLIGQSKCMRRLYELVELIAPTDVTVLLGGESGTGKGVTARVIHENSNRRSKPFVGVDCATLPETLVESELFGHQKGAFTGSTESRIGKFEAANGGTVFLDEIGNLTPSVQAKLLRVIQERKVEPVGSTRSIPLDIRIVAASNVDLREAVSAGTFRADLYHRLNEFFINIPPFRDREEDVVLLAMHFLKEMSARYSKPNLASISPQAGRMLMEYQWPGNVRELKNEVQRAVLLAPGDTLGPEHFSSHVRTSRPAESPGIELSMKCFAGLSLKEATQRHSSLVERWLIRETLKRTTTAASPRSTALLIALRSSRTLPGQSYAIKYEIASSEMALTSLPSCLFVSFMNRLARNRMSSLRSRRFGTRTTYSANR